MCNEIKFNDIHSKRGSKLVVQVFETKVIKTPLWGGWVRDDKCEDYWIPRGHAKAVIICADTFVEGKVEFKVPGKCIAGLGLNKDVVVGKDAHKYKKGEVMVITRSSMSPFEAGIHDRWPVVHDADGKVYIFTPEDAVDGQVQLELLK